MQNCSRSDASLEVAHQDIVFLLEKFSSTNSPPRRGGAGHLDIPSIYQYLLTTQKIYSPKPSGSFSRFLCLYSLLKNDSPLQWPLKR